MSRTKLQLEKPKATGMKRGYVRACAHLMCLEDDGGLRSSRFIGRLFLSTLFWLSSVSAVHAQQPQVFLTFDYSMTPAQAAATNGRYVFVWGDSASMTFAFAKYSPRTLLSAYFPYARDPDASHDLDYWQAHHPTWVAYRCDGITPAYFPGDANMPLDISNPAVVEWQLGIFTHLRPGLKAVALDNFQFENKLGVCGVRNESGKFVRKYSGKLRDPVFADDIVHWLKKIAIALHEHHIKVIVNHIPDLTPDGDNPTSPLVVEMVGAVDGILDEHAQDALHDAAKAVSLAALAQYVQSKGKWVYFIYQYQGDNPRFTESAMANYLTMAGPKTAIYIPFTGTVSGREPGFHGFDRLIGEPCEPVSIRSGVWFRRFSHGLAIFAPADHPLSSVPIPHGYQTVNGQAAGTAIRLEGGQGRVLYAPSGSGCSTANASKK